MPNIILAVSTLIGFRDNATTLYTTPDPRRLRHNSGGFGPECGKLHTLRPRFGNKASNWVTSHVFDAARSERPIIDSIGVAVGLTGF